MSVQQNNFPRISVIIPSYNQGHFIKETLDSIITQDYPNIEIIVIDGGSTDGTVKILEEYDSFLYYWISEKDKGQSNALNKGIEIATGDFIAWQNSDDIFLPGALNALVNKAKMGFDVVYSSILGIDAIGRVINRIYYVPFSPVLLKYYSIAFTNQAALYRADFLKVLKIDESLHYAMDFDLEFRLYKAGASFGFVKGFWGAIRFHADAKTVNEFYGKTKIEENSVRGKNGIFLKEGQSVWQKFPMQWLFTMIYLIWYRMLFGGLYYKILKVFGKNEPDIFKR